MRTPENELSGRDDRTSFQMIAASDAKPGDRVSRVQLTGTFTGDRKALVTGVQVRGPFVVIDTDAGVAGMLPVNRTITVQRDAPSSGSPGN